MIARPSKRHVLAALVALILIGIERPTLAQAPAAPAKPPSAAAILLAKQIHELMCAKSLCAQDMSGVRIDVEDM